MIDRIDAQLEAWVRELFGDVGFTLDPPGKGTDGPTVSCYLFAFAEQPPLRAPQRVPLQFAARYLVTATTASAEQAHRLLETLAFAAMEKTEWELELEPIAPGYWQAFGLSPRPSFVIRVPVTQPRPESPVRRVRRPLEVRTVPMSDLHGIVLGPDDVPLAGVRVTLPTLECATSTDLDGRFVFSAVPAEPGTRRFQVWAKGKEFHLEAEQPVSDADLITLRLDLDD